MSFGKRLRELRLKAGMSQRELAGAIGVTISYLSKIETEEVESPSEERIFKIADAVRRKVGAEVDVDELFALAKKIPSSLMSDPGKVRKAIRYLRSVSGDMSGGEE